MRPPAAGAFLSERHSISEADVREVIDELQEEFAAGSRPVATAVDVGGIAVDQLDLSRLQASPALAGEAARLAANFDVQRIEARLAGIEQNMAATLGVLNQLLQAVRRDPPAEESVQ